MHHHVAAVYGYFNQLCTFAVWKRRSLCTWGKGSAWTERVGQEEWVGSYTRCWHMAAAGLSWHQLAQFSLLQGESNPFMQQLANLVPTKAFLQPSPAATMCRAPCRWTHSSSLPEMSEGIPFSMLIYGSITSSLAGKVVWVVRVTSWFIVAGSALCNLVQFGARALTEMKIWQIEGSLIPRSHLFFCSLVCIQYHTEKKKPRKEAIILKACRC